VRSCAEQSEGGGVSLRSEAARGILGEKYGGHFSAARFDFHSPLCSHGFRWEFARTHCPDSRHDNFTAERHGALGDAHCFCLGLRVHYHWPGWFPIPGHIEVADFLVAGSSILLVLSIKDLVPEE